MKDRIVNVPVFAEDVTESIKSLPRTPHSAGIIPVKFKRKMSFKNSHLVQFISVDKVTLALKTLKALGHMSRALDLTLRGLTKPLRGVSQPAYLLTTFQYCLIDDFLG